MALDFPSNPEVGDTHETAGTVYTWTGNRWLARSYRLDYPVPIYTNMVLTTPRVDDDSGNDRPEILQTQEQVNEFILSAAEKTFKATTRAEDQVDFLQNSVGKGQWINGDQTIPDDEDESPMTGEFWTDSNEFNKITKFKFNDTPLPGFNTSKTLEGTKVGDYLTVQCTDNNGFGQYVIKDMTVGDRKAGRLVRTFDVSLVREHRGQGELQSGTKTAVTTSRPLSVIVQDKQPVVSSRGILWYRQSDDHLFISNWADGQAGEGEQWTDLTAGGDFLPLTGGKVTGNVTIDQASGTALNIKKSGVDKVKIEHGGRIFCSYDLSLDEDLRTVTTKGWVDSEIRTKGDERYLQLAEGGKVTGYVQFQDDTKLQMGGTYNNNIIDGKEGFTDNSIVATLGYVGHEIRENLSIGSLSPKDKLYLQGFYPFVVSSNTTASAGEIVFQDYNYSLELDPEKWKYIMYSVEDAYGQDLAGTFMNHMDTRNLVDQNAQIWLVKENGRKICSFVGPLPLHDNNFAERSNMTINSECELLNPPHYDTAPLRIDAGEIIWIKHSRWGN